MAIQEVLFQDNERGFKIFDKRDSNSPYKGLFALAHSGSAYSIDSINAYFKGHKPEFGNDLHIKLLRLYSMLLNYIDNEKEDK